MVVPGLEDRELEVRSFFLGEDGLEPDSGAQPREAANATGLSSGVG